MKEFKFIITDPDGIHARPAGEFVKAAKEFESCIALSKDGKTADAKKIFGLMGLAAKQGDEVTVTIEGPYEDIAAEVIKQFMNENL